MNSSSLRGPFTCRVTLEIVRAPNFVRREEDGITYLTGRDYELAYRTVLRFANGAELPVTAKLFGDLNQQVVIRDENGRPVQISGYAQGRSEISEVEGRVIFCGAYYDSRITQALAGDDALTPVGTRTIDHWQSGFGRGAFSGHAFSLGVRLLREADVPGSRPTGDATGQID